MKNILLLLTLGLISFSSTTFAAAERTNSEEDPLLATQEEDSGDTADEAIFFCTICHNTILDDIPRDEAGLIPERTLPCSHTFHEFCIGRWLQAQVRCPICRCHVSTGQPQGDTAPPGPVDMATFREQLAQLLLERQREKIHFKHFFYK